MTDLTISYINTHNIYRISKEMNNFTTNMTCSNQYKCKKRKVDDRKTYFVSSKLQIRQN